MWVFFNLVEFAHQRMKRIRFNFYLCPSGRLTRWFEVNESIHAWIFTSKQWTFCGQKFVTNVTSTCIKADESLFRKHLTLKLTSLRISTKITHNYNDHLLWLHKTWWIRGPYYASACPAFPQSHILYKLLFCEVSQT